MQRKEMLNTFCLKKLNLYQVLYRLEKPLILTFFSGQNDYRLTVTFHGHQEVYTARRRLKVSQEKKPVLTIHR